jgi:hypothetical protein
MSFKNPLVPLIVDPVNLDRPIQELQVALANGLPWLERSFGRSWDAYETTRGSLGGAKLIAYPQVWQGDGLDLLSVMPNDNLTSQSFFKVEDPIEVTDYIPDGWALMRAKVSLVFWANLKRLAPDKNYNFIEVLKGHAQRVITKAPLSDPAAVKIVRTWEKPADVFKGYDLSKLTTELIYPYTGFRFELEINYQEDCPEVNLEGDGSDGGGYLSVGGGGFLRI